MLSAQAVLRSHATSMEYACKLRQRANATRTSTTGSGTVQCATPAPRIGGAVRAIGNVPTGTDFSVEGMDSAATTSCVGATPRAPQGSGAAPIVPSVRTDTLALRARLSARGRPATRATARETAARVCKALVCARATGIASQGTGPASSAMRVPTTGSGSTAPSRARLGCRTSPAQGEAHAMMAFLGPERAHVSALLVGAHVQSAQWGIGALIAPISAQDWLASRALGAVCATTRRALMDSAPASTDTVAVCASTTAPLVHTVSAMGRVCAY